MSRPWVTQHAELACTVDFGRAGGLGPGQAEVKALHWAAANGQRWQFERESDQRFSSPIASCMCMCAEGVAGLCSFASAVRFAKLSLPACQRLSLAAVMLQSRFTDRPGD